MEKSAEGCELMRLCLAVGPAMITEQARAFFECQKQVIANGADFYGVDASRP